MNVPIDIAQRYAAAIRSESEAIGSARCQESQIILRRMLVGLPTFRADNLFRAKVVSLAEYRLQRSLEA